MRHQIVENLDVRQILCQLAVALEETREPFAFLVQRALTRSDEKLQQFLISNELWGGSGSIADSAFDTSESKAIRFYELMIKLAKHQIEVGKVNVRTEGWVSAFEHWIRLRE
jgi:hypothetical protein